MTEKLSRNGEFNHDESPSKPTWFSTQSDGKRLLACGFRLAESSAHQSKTVMFKEIEALLAAGYVDAPALKSAALDDNAIGKSTTNTRRLTFKHMSSLYGLMEQPPLTSLFLSLWKLDQSGHRLQAILIALARDSILRATAPVIFEGAIGESVHRVQFEESLLSAFPDRFSEKTNRSLAQNCASSWTQSGHLKGRAKKERQRVLPTPATVALAALLATVCGFGGPAILSSAWMRVLDLTPEQSLDYLRRAEAIGLARVRSAGDVIEISVRQAMAVTLGVRSLEHV